MRRTAKHNATVLSFADFSGGVLYIDHFATDDYQYLFRRAREFEVQHARGQCIFENRRML